MESHHRVITSISLFTIHLLCALPLFFLPFIESYYDTAKWTILMAIAAIIVLVWTIRSVLTHKLSISVSNGSLGFVLLASVSFISLLVSSINKVEALINPFGFPTFAALAVVTLCVPVLLQKTSHAAISWFLIAFTTILAIITIYQFAGMNAVMFPGIAFLSDRLWTPTGSPLATLAILAIMIPFVISRVHDVWKQRHEAIVPILILILIVNTVGVSILLWQIIPKLPGSIFPLTAGWSIALEVLKNPKWIATGVGAENFVTAFNLGKPLSYNVSPLWNIRFNASSSFVFHMLTVYGILGVAATIYLLKIMMEKTNRGGISIPCTLAAIAFLLLPPSIDVLTVATLLLMLSEDRAIREIQIPKKQKWIPPVLFLVVLAGVIGSGFALFRFYRAEFSYFRSLVRANGNDGTGAYNFQIQAISNNPYMSRYHMALSQTSIALAQTLSSASDSAAQTSLIMQLAQQAVREAKIAISLAPNGLSWENLARIYSLLIPSTNGAYDWSVTSFRQATTLDPANPMLHMELGFIFTRQKNYSQAITEFLRAASLKPNYASAFYNLANVYRANGDTQNAIQALVQTQLFLDPVTSDYQLVTNTLKDLNEQVNAKESSSSAKKLTGPAQTLITPEPSPVAVPTLTLPDSAGP